METKQWLIDNEKILFGQLKLERSKIDEMIVVYNSITGENKKVTSCGRCIYNIISRLKAELIRLQNKEKVYIYRTNWGHLTLTATNKIAYTHYLDKGESAQSILEHYKQLEKNK